MSRSEPWATLGLAPTSDIRAVRSAYAARLKQIDVDRDPDAFRTLREHHDWALYIARSMAEPHHDDLDAVLAAPDEAMVAVGEQGVPSQDGPDATGIDADDPADAIERQKIRIWQLLTDEKFGPWHGQRIAAETRALLDLPILENIDVTAETEHWLAAVIAQTIPRSDPIVAMVIEQFGWERLEGKVGGFHGLHHALQRLKDIECSARLRNPEHKWHQAFLYLQQPPQPDVTAPKKRDVGNHINNLLESIRFHNPTVEAELNPEHVAQWDGFINEAVRNKEAIEPIRTSTWSNTFGSVPVWGWFVIFYVVAILFGS